MNERQAILERLAAVDEAGLSREDRLGLARCRFQENLWDPIAGDKPEGWDELPDELPEGAAGLSKREYTKAAMYGIEDARRDIDRGSPGYYMHRFGSGENWEDFVRGTIQLWLAMVRPAKRKTRIRRWFERVDWSRLGLIALALLVLLVVGVLAASHISLPN